MKKIKKALISISNKKNLYLLLKSLAKFKIQLISSGGTYKEIKKLGFKCQEISKYTGSPEILGGRVKTLHPKIHAGILSKRNNKSHQKDLIKNNFEKIDLVIVNFYPFEKTLESTNSHNKIIENIDVGGPTMVRSAAKNNKHVAIVVNSGDYASILEELTDTGGLSQATRTDLACKAFEHTDNTFQTAVSYSLLGNAVPQANYSQFKWPYIEGSTEDQSMAVALRALTAQWEFMSGQGARGWVAMDSSSLEWLSKVASKPLFSVNDAANLYCSTGKKQLWLALQNLPSMTVS